MATAKVALQLVDVLNQPLQDSNILIEFFSSDSSKHFRTVVSPNGGANITINLQDSGNSIYRVMIMPSNYRTLQFFLRVTEGATVTRDPVVFPVNPDKVVDINAPASAALPAPLQNMLTNASLDNFKDVAGNPLQGPALYNALPPLLKAALLNLYTKAAATKLGDQNSVFDKLGVLITLNQDRLFAKTGASLLEETMQDTFFHKVDDTLHKTKPDYKIFTSYKTRDDRGNLQLTFSRKGDTGNDYLVDMDIDEAQGIGHIFEVVQNTVTSGLTNPYDVREILMAKQQLRPLYNFRFATTGAAAAAAAV